MKKLYAVAAMLCCTAAFAQQKPQTNAPLVQTDKNTSVKFDTERIQRLPGINSTQFRVPIISEDFESLTAPAIPAGWTANTVDPSYGGFYTGDEADANVGGFWPVPNNGSTQFIMTNDDALGSPDGGDLEDEQLILPVMNLSAAGGSNYGLTFDAFHDMNYGSGDAEVRVSTDAGANWTTLLTLTPDQSNWQTNVVDLSAYDNDTAVWVMFYWNDGAVAAGTNWGTGLALDNIVVDAIPNNNLTINSTIGADLQVDWDYTMIPLSQAREVAMTVDYTNNGVIDQPNTTFSWTIDDGSGQVAFGNWTGTPFLAPSFVRDSVVITGTGFTPSAIDVYDLEAVIGSDSTDFDSNDNFGGTSFEVTQYTWARDYDVADGGISNIAGGTGQPFAIGHQFIATANDIVYGADVAVTTASTNTGQLWYASIFEYDANAQDFIYMDQTNDVTIDASHLGAFHTAQFSSPVNLTAGNQYLLVAGHYGGTDDVSFATSGATQEGSVLGYDGGNALFSLISPPSPMVRMNFDPNISIDDLATTGVTALTNMPNPFAETTMISYELANASNVSIEVMDITGKVVMVLEQGQQAAGVHNTTLNASDLSAGVYNYTLVAGDSRITKRLIVAK